MQHVTHEGLNCIYCGKECKNKNSLAQHECRCKNNPNRYNTESHLSNQGWAKGLTKETDQRIKNNSEVAKIYWQTHEGTMKGKHHSTETKKKLSNYALNNNYQSHFGVHKSYDYNGNKFISSYEVTVAKELDLNNVNWVKPSYGTFKYKDANNKVHTYTPDFYLPDYNIYLDPKNDYLINHVNPTLGYSDVDKINWVMKQNNVIILILDKDHLNWASIIAMIDRMEERFISQSC